MTVTPPNLTANPGWGDPTGPHGEIRVPVGTTDADIRDIIKARVFAAKFPSGAGVVTFERRGMDSGQQIVAFEVN